MNILLCFNDRFVPVVRPLIISLMCHHQELHFYIGYLNLSEANRQILKELVEGKCPAGNWPWDEGEFKKETINRTIEFVKFIFPANLTVRAVKRFGIDTWTRCFVWEQLPVDRLLYLDADIIVNGNVERFYYDDLGDNLIKACPDYILYCTNPAKSWGGSLLDLQTDHGYKNVGLYCNAGVVLFDVAKMRSEGITAQVLLNYHQALTKPLRMNDQDLINLFFEGRIKLANPYRYNLTTPPLTKINVDELNTFANTDFSESPYPTDSASPTETTTNGAAFDPNNIVIYHYSAKAKPHALGYRHKFASVYWRYHNLDPLSGFKDKVIRLLQPCWRVTRNLIPDHPFAFLKRKKR